MKNADELLKRILLNMRYDSSKTLNEQSIGDEVTVTAKKTNYFDISPKLKTTEGNTELDNRKVIDCKTGEQYISNNFTIEITFKPLSTSEWVEMQNGLLKENKVNSLTACKYYSTILVDHQKRGVGDYLNKSQTNITDYDKKVEECITASFAAYNAKPDGCSNIIKYFSKSLENQGNKDPFIKIQYMMDSWFLTEYKKWGQDKDYTPKSPSLMSQTAKYYTIRNGKRDSVVNIEDFKLDSSEDNLTQGLSNASSEFDLSTELPLTNDEKMEMFNTPIDRNGEFKGGNYICKKPNVQFVNLRTGPGVNEDTGIFDPTDNYINWGGDEIVGKFITQKRQTPASVNVEEKLKKFIGSLTKSDIKNILKHLENKGWANEKLYPTAKTTIKQDLLSNNSGIINFALSTIIKSPKNKELLPPEIYKKLPGTQKQYLWYKVEFLKPIYDAHEGDTYKEGWVREDNVKFCEKTTDPNSETNYNNELLKRVPIKPLKDPTVK